MEQPGQEPEEGGASPTIAGAGSAEADRAGAQRLRGLARALEARTGLVSSARRWARTPTRPGWARVPGGALLVLLLSQVVTGVALACYYAPSALSAWESVHHLEERVLLGSFVRGLHAFGASAVVVLAIVHGFQVGWRQGYRPPRELNWALGLLLVPVLAAFALTGHLLPWDQKGYWATEVATGIVRGTPVVGEALAQAVRGGSSLGSWTLTRFYALHTIVLPAALVLLVGLHLRLWRRQARRRAGPPAEARGGGLRAPYWPGQAGRDLLAAALVLAVIAALAAWRGAGLEAPADPASAYPPRPEWYFAPLRELLKTVAEPWGSVVLPGALFLALLALPWLDREPGPGATRHTARSLAARALLVAPLVAYLGLLAQSALSDLADAELQAGQAVAREDAELARRLAREGVPPAGAAELLRRHPPRWGRALYEEHCARCHRLDGVGGPVGEARGDGGPDLTGYLSVPWLRDLLRAPQDRRFFGLTHLNTMEPMPRETWGDLDALATFLRAQDPEVRPQLADELVRRGEAAFREHDCHTCHPLEPGVADLGPNLAGYGSEAWLMAFLRDPGHELFYAEDNEMPAYRDELSPEELRALTVFLRGLADPAPPRPR